MGREEFREALLQCGLRITTADGSGVVVFCVADLLRFPNRERFPITHRRTYSCTAKYWMDGSIPKRIAYRGDTTTFTLCASRRKHEPALARGLSPARAITS
jgi:hypothetical protein